MAFRYKIGNVSSGLPAKQTEISSIMSCPLGFYYKQETLPPPLERSLVCFSFVCLFACFYIKETGNTLTFCIKLLGSLLPFQVAHYLNSYLFCYFLFAFSVGK